MIAPQQLSNTAFNQSTLRSKSNRVQNQLEQTLPDPPNNLQVIVEASNGAETSTPTRPATNQAPGNPEPGAAAEQKVVKEGIKLTKKIIVIGVLILMAVAALITVTVVLLLKSPGPTFIVTKMHTSAKLAGSSEIDGERIKTTDPETFKSDKPLSIFASRIRRPIRRNPRPRDEERRLQEQKEAQKQQEYSSYSFRDQYTGTLISVSSKDLQLKATIDLSTALAYVLNNQPLPEDVQNSNRNLQEQDVSLNETILYKEFTFYQVNDQIADSVKSELSKQDSNLRVSQEVALDVQFNQEKNAFEFAALKASPPQEESVAFVDPKNTPIISNINNETEVAQAVTAVVSGVLAKAKEFLTKRMDDLEKVSDVDLVQTQKTNGTTSIYVDQPQDIGKLCANIDETTMRCDSRALSSSIMNVEAPTEGQDVNGRSTIVVHIDM